MRKLIPLLAAVCVAFTALLAAQISPARADSTTMYHFTDNSTGVCTNVTFPQDNWFDNQVGPANHISETTALKFIDNGGIFGVGWVATGQVDVIPSYLPEFENLFVGGPSLNPTGDPEGESGGPYSAVAFYTLATGACVITPQMLAQESHILACASKPVLRADGTIGRFLDIALGYLEGRSWNGVSFVPAFMVQGVGATCDIPAGYHFAGYSVTSDYSVNPSDPTANIYPYWAKN